MINELLYIRRLSKTTSGALLRNISLTVHEKEIIGLVGDLASGIQSIIKILQGTEGFDSGTIYIQGKKYLSSSISDHRKDGVFYIDPKDLLLDNLSVADNLMLAKPTHTRRLFINKRFVRNSAKRILDLFSVDITPNEKVYMLTDYEKYALSVIKAYICGAKVFLVGNSLFNLNGYWQLKLIQLLKKIALTGACILVFVPEIEDITSWVNKLIVMRNGRIEGAFYASDVRPEIINQLLGVNRAAVGSINSQRSQFEQPLLCFKDLWIGEKAYPDVKAFKGEIIRFVRENGHIDKSIIYLLRGLNSYKGHVYIDTTEVTIRNIQDAIAQGIAYLPTYGENDIIWDNLSIGDNLAIRAPHIYSRYGFIRERMIKFACGEYFENSSIPLVATNYSPSILSPHQRLELSLIILKSRKPRIVLLDDSYTNCDTEMRSQIDCFVRDMLRSGCTIVCSEIPKSSCDLFPIRDIEI